MNPESTPSGLLSVERVVAFVLGPAVTAGSGWLSLLLAKKFGIHVGGAEITGIFATGGLAAAGLAYKWLHGRQIEMTVEGALAKAEGVPGATDFIHTTIQDLEGLAQSAATRAVQEVTGGKAPPSATDLAGGGAAE